MDADEYRRMAAAGERHWWYRSTRALLRQLLIPHLRGARLVLDAGGGTGATGGWMSAHAPVVLADYDAFALEVAAEDFAGVVPVRADLNRLPFAPGTFDAVLCVTALCHRMNPDPAAIVADFARLTRPGGVVAIMEPGGKRLWRGHDEVTHTARRFSVAELADMCRAAGLEVLTATGAYSFLVPPAWVLGKIERGKATSDVGRNESGLFGLLGAIAAAERALLRRRSLPWGLSAVVIARRNAPERSVPATDRDGA